MIKDRLHQQIVRHSHRVQEWFLKKSKNRGFPFYCSFDLRDSSRKITPVDANLFPAGFNNICEIDKRGAPDLCREFLNQAGWQGACAILLAEEHTHNPFYWDNIYSLQELLKQSGVKKVWVCVPGQNIPEDRVFKSAGGREVEVFVLKNKTSEADFIISNNDFSVDYGLSVPVPMTPPLVAGWKHRRKDSFFDQYNLLAREFAELVEVEDSTLTIQTKRFKEFNINDKACLERLKQEVNIFLKSLEPVYKKWNQKPFVFLKNNAGTYGLGMTTIGCASDIDGWNYKVRKKMKATKGGGGIKELIIQEGVASHLQTQGAVAEPVIYLLGHRLAGGFLRTHKSKGVRESLNSPGAVFRTLCISDLEMEVEGKPMENVYGWVAYLGVLALAREFQSTGFMGRASSSHPTEPS